ncbi:SigE family RNA polymerase sigma factor [Streptomyces sp. NE06-03E]|uniref:SigE family RNA polymerase sigma factor n=1 Tax=Streptomyces silvae TaxID=2803812 RepID=A0ABU8A8E6_9ACTN|nr:MULTISPECIES: SigE family RNA polymerase sigma factor [unclassified Streptomyces]WSS64502.1 SigE family RNA polymerase sigma factor [Streptomyces sp. NBC_01177]WSS71496.1 SigE family RNA polymerase sigma factor [Streptomyces sp. NBC_01175]WSS78506.1 SigE family RNA polymerase sigma factor [Streptomyces sp. NBC_01174]MDX3056252.1 SigE family RNA polymerase sigma factor [Streptomyces sp. NE06-03E]MDX3327807.1 SigE family RNA polymerase sigma factor [Streptomyces sp. ME02-6979-3A]
MRKSREDGFIEFAGGLTGHLFRSACLLTSGDTHLAEDLVQETLGRMYLRWGRMSHVDNPAAYAQTVLVRTFLTHRRRRSSDERPVAELPDAPLITGSDPLLRLALLKALGQLPPKDRAVVVLRYWEDRSIDETADAMNISSSAVRTRASRALVRLRAQLGGSLAELVAAT